MPPRILITESGRDVGGGAGDGWLKAKHPDGRPWTEVDYLRFTKAQAAQYPAYIPLILYCYGRGWSTQQHPEGDWASFDISKAYWYLDQLAAYNATVPTLEAPPVATTPVSLPAGTPTFQATISAPTGPINVRNAPSTNASVVGSALAGGRVLTFAEPDKYPEWYWVNAGNFSGWINKLRGYPTPLKLTPADIVLTPEPVEGVTLTADELEQLAENFSEIAGIFRGAVLRG